MLKFIFTLVLLSSAVAIANECKPFGENNLSSHSSFKVNKYRSELFICSYNRQNYISLRSFKLDGIKVRLLVNPVTTKSFIANQSCLASCEKLSEEELLNTPYGATLDQSQLAPYPLKNDGLQFGVSKEHIALTIDMCPSSRGVSDDVYNRLERLSDELGDTIPVGIAMTRRWKKRWPEHFENLKRLHLDGKLSIEWINHSSNHRYHKDVPIKENFLLMPKTNMKDEVIGNEISLIESGVTPSPYFRFPGLVSDFDLISYVSGHGLITLGSNAWLGKKQVPTFGSIILIHGNRNEVKGEKKFLKYVETMDQQNHKFGTLGEVLTYK